MKLPPTPEEKANIADRYLRGQSVKFISFATSRSRAVVKAALAEHGIRVDPRQKRNRNWGYAGGRL